MFFVTLLRVCFLSAHTNSSDLSNIEPSECSSLEVAALPRRAEKLCRREIVATHAMDGAGACELQARHYQTILYPTSMEASWDRFPPIPKPGRT